MKIAIKELKAYFLGDVFTMLREDEILDLHVAIDSRLVKPGDIFACLPGEKTDGHFFISDAIKNGAIGILTECKQDISDTYIQIITKSTEKALRNAAKMILNHYPIEQIGITGSAGKTTTKELLFTLLSPYQKTSKTIGNYNTPIGVPVSIINMDETSKFFLCELSASYPGEIDQNLSFLDLSIAIITGIGPSHLEFFNSVERVFEEKLRIVNALKPGGKLIINGDQDWGQKAKQNLNNVITYGFSDLNDMQAYEIRDSLDGLIFTVRIHNKIWKDFRLLAFGEHFILDSLPGIFLAISYGMKEKDIKEALSGFNADYGRGKRIPFIKSSMIIDESYNANPLSFEVALQSFLKLDFPRKILVMGDMLELGPNAEKLHFEIGSKISKTDLAVVCYLGAYSDSIRSALKDSSVLFYSFKDIDEIESFLISSVQNNDGILVKASNGIGLHQLIKKVVRLKW